MVKCFYCDKIAPYINSAEIEITLKGLPEQGGFHSILHARICPGCMDSIRDDTDWCFGLKEEKDDGQRTEG